MCVFCVRVRACFHMRVRVGMFMYIFFVWLVCINALQLESIYNNKNIKMRKIMVTMIMDRCD